MNIFHVIILGMVEGVTEFLPISSTGHLILIQALLHIPETPFAKLFDIVIQLAAVAAVAGMYVRYLWGKKTLWMKLFVAFLPTGVVGLLLYKIVKQYFLGNVPLVIGALFVGGIAIIVFDTFFVKNHRTNLEKLPLPRALVIGLFQTLSIIPGVSRAAATIIGGETIGLSREDAVLFSFLLAIPTMAAASGYDLVKNSKLLTAANLGLLGLGMLVSFVTAWISIRTFLRFVKTHTLVPFGIYRIALAGVLALLLLWK